MTVIQADAATTPPFDRRAMARRAHLWLGLLLLAVCTLSLETGASSVSPVDLMTGRAAPDALSAVVLWEIRLPRVALGALVGAALAVSGAVMQGLFRNSLADPGIVGVSAGAGLGAVAAIVLGGLLPRTLQGTIGVYTVPLATFLGGWASVMLLYSVATRGGRNSVATMLLAWIALGALSGAVSGQLVYAADDEQLRDVTFWGLGSLAGATWVKLAVAAPVIASAVVGATLLGRGLNGLALLGASLLLAADMISRIVIAPAELPIGIVTAVLGAPVFLWILLQRRGLVDL